MEISKLQNYLIDNVNYPGEDVLNYFTFGLKERNRQREKSKKTKNKDSAVVSVCCSQCGTKKKLAVAKVDDGVNHNTPVIVSAVPDSDSKENLKEEGKEEGKDTSKEHKEPKEPKAPKAPKAPKMPKAPKAPKEPSVKEEESPTFPHPDEPSFVVKPNIPGNLKNKAGKL
jgi:type IV secretory pathway VirB10-like protein